MNDAGGFAQQHQTLAFVIPIAISAGALAVSVFTFLSNRRKQQREHQEQTHQQGVHETEMFLLKKAWELRNKNIEPWLSYSQCLSEVKDQSRLDAALRNLKACPVGGHGDYWQLPEVPTLQRQVHR